MIKNRSQRRHHKFRIIKKWYELHRAKFSVYDNEQELKEYARNTASRGSYKCGCTMCANPRHNGWDNSRSIQEQKHYQYDWESEY